MLPVKGKPGRGPGAVPRRRYRVGTLEKGLTVLEVLVSEARPLTIKELAERTGIERTAVFRLLSTLEERRYVTRFADKRYSCTPWHRRIVLAYLAPLSGHALRTSLLESVARAASRPHIELLTLDNEVDNAAAAERNADRAIETGAAAVVMYQPEAAIAHAIAHRLAAAGVPLISVCTPIEGVVYFGPDNYRSGKLAGEVLARFAASHWAGHADHLVILEPAQLSGESQSRIAGVRFGFDHAHGRAGAVQLLHTQRRNYVEEARDLIARLLAGTPRRDTVALACFTDPTAIGAGQAVRAAGRDAQVAIVSQSGSGEGRAELCSAGTRLIASIGYFPERWGERLVELAFSMVNRHPVPPAVNVESVVLTRDNVARYYPAPRDLPELAQSRAAGQ
jgi:ribose transport system substrate-binding protein